MSTRTRSRNAFESNLDGALSAGATSIVIDSATGLVPPLYLVLDPENPVQREYVYVGGISTDTLTGVTRGLDGSAAGSPFDHNSGVVIRAVPVHQWLDDIFDDIEQNETDIAAAEADIATLQGTDHAQIHAIDGADHTGAILHSDTGGIDPDDHHDEAHTVASHSDTGATGAELNTLTDGSDADALHVHDFIDPGTVEATAIDTVDDMAFPQTSDSLLISMSLSIPGDWNGYFIDTEFLFEVFDPSTGTSFEYWHKVASTEGTHITSFTALAAASQPHFGSRHRFTGQTSTGSRTVSVRTNGIAAGKSLRNAWLYARAVRTS